MQIILPTGDIIDTRFDLDQRVMFKHGAPDAFGFVVAVAVGTGGSLSYYVSFAGNRIEAVEVELWETEDDGYEEQVKGGDHRDPE